jgi:hypothetical protein
MKLTAPQKPRNPASRHSGVNRNPGFSGGSIPGLRFSPERRKRGAVNDLQIKRLHGVNEAHFLMKFHTS